SEKHANVVQLLVENGANVQARTRSDVPPQGDRRRARRGDGGTSFEMSGSGGFASGFTPLLFAARSGDVPSARLLLDAGANVNDRADNNWTALVLAVVRANIEVATLLLERGEDANDEGSGVA